MAASSNPDNRTFIETVKDSALDHLINAVDTARNVIASGGWAYPLLGIFHTTTHPELFKPLVPTLLRCAATAFGVTIGLFIFTYVPQVAFCAIFSGPLAFITAALLVLGESYILTVFVCKHFLARARDQLFDAVLIQQGGERLAAKGREIRSTNTGTKKLGEKFSRPFTRFNKEEAIRYVVSLPINAVPVVGTIMFLTYNGEHVGPGYHERYFQLKEFDELRRKAFIRNRQASYTAFGATALGLQLIPVVGLLFGLTSTVGAALWAVQIEKKNEAGPNVAPIPEENEVPVEL